jgi:hypothetical protein
MLDSVIGVPFGDHFVEGIILDIPSLVPQMDGSLDRKLGRRMRGHPDPVTSLWIVLLVDLPANGVGLPGTNGAHGAFT